MHQEYTLNWSQCKVFLVNYVSVCLSAYMSVCLYLSV